MSWLEVGGRNDVVGTRVVVRLGGWLGGRRCCSCLSAG